MDKETGFSHLGERGEARMVDVSGKSATARVAVAEAWVNVGPEIAAKMRETGGVAKGNVIETARLAAVMAAKRTGELIPMCHPLVLDSINVTGELRGDRVRIQASVSCEGKTGVEMEAMTAASLGALTVYDMVKSMGKGVEIGPVRLLKKSGGKSGTWRREDNQDAEG